MADQIQVTKTNAYVVTGIADDDEVRIPKINLYAILQPGEGDDPEPRANGGVFMNIVRKRT